MITITIDNQQFEIGPDSMQVENEEVFELIKNSSRVFDSYSVNNLGPYVLEILSYNTPIDNFAFCLKNNAQRVTDIYYNYISYQRKMCTLKHSKFQLQSDVPLRYINNLIEVIYDRNRYTLDVSVVKGSYLSHPNIIVYAKMIKAVYYLDSLWHLPLNRWYELYIKYLTLDSYFCKYAKLWDKLTKLSPFPFESSF